MGRASPYPDSLPQAEAKPSRRQLERALLLIARQHGGDPATAQAARRELESWRQADPTHEAAYQAAARGWAATDARALRSDFALPPPRGERLRARRRVLSALGVAGLLCGLAGLGMRFGQGPVYELALETAAGQVQTVSLPDGTRLDVGANTAAQIAYYRDRREVRLVEGEIRLEVSRDAARPLTVATEWGRVRVLGTVFSVAARDARMSVAVAEGRVAVSAASVRPGAADVHPAAAELTAGQRIEADAYGLGERGAVQAEDVGAWRKGWLVFDATPLGEAVARWNDYLAKPIALADDPALHELRFTGSFPLRDAGAFVASLPDILPVRVQAGDDGSVLIEARR